MDDAAVGRALYVLRRRARLRQRDLAAKAGVSHDTVSRVELGRIDGMTHGVVRRIFAAAGASVRLDIRWHGAALDRLLDERHATLQAATAGALDALGWEVRPEVTYSEYGERGSIDLLALHAGRRSAAVIEVKTELVSIEATLRKLDEKVRLVPTIVMRQDGWRPVSIARIVVLPGDSSNRRRVELHRSTLGKGLPARAKELRAWLRGQSAAGVAATIGGIWFLSPADHMRLRQPVAGRGRVRSSR
jgi:transcriptional regulator with XRE-family HTH domain